MIEITLAVLICVVATVYDLRTRSIPDRLTFGGMIAGLVVNVVLEAARGGRGDALLMAAAMSAAGAGACAILPLAAVIRGKLGGGDLKLFIALGAILGPLVGFEAQIYAVVAAFVVAPIFAWRKGRLRSALRFVGAQIRRSLRGKKASEPLPEHEVSWMPLAPAILAGVVLAAASSVTTSWH